MEITALELYQTLKPEYDKGILKSKCQTEEQFIVYCMERYAELNDENPWLDATTQKPANGKTVWLGNSAGEVTKGHYLSDYYIQRGAWLTSSGRVVTAVTHFKLAATEKAPKPPKFK